MDAEHNSKIFPLPFLQSKLPADLFVELHDIIDIVKFTPLVCFMSETRGHWVGGELHAR